MWSASPTRANFEAPPMSCDVSYVQGRKTMGLEPIHMCLCVCIYIYIYTHIHTYIYIYIYREREI